MACAQVIVIDEIGTEAEALAARTIAERGVQLVATCHGTVPCLVALLTCATKGSCPALVASNVESDEGRLAVGMALESVCLW